MNKSLRLWVGGIILLFFSLSGKAMPFKLTPPILVLDNPHFTESIKSFRIPKQSTLQLPEPFTAGLKNLNASASGQFNQATLQRAISKVPSKKLVIVDLRYEPHGFADGQALSWYGKRIPDKVNLDPKVVFEKEQQLLQSLRENKKFKVNEIVEKEAGIILKVKPHYITAQTIESEKELVERLGYQYHRLPVVDRHPPSDIVMQNFIDFVMNAPSDTWYHFHCRAGKGRATTFIVLYDIIQNGDKLSFESIIDRHALLGPKNLRELSDSKEDQWKLALAKERLEKIHQFYKYRSSEVFGKLSWADWLQSQPS